MKKILLFCVTIALLCALYGAASANGWGLKGALLSAVSKTHTWDEYTLAGNQANEFAVLGTQYHNALFWADGSGTLRAFTTAVYQPEDKAAPPRLSLEEDGRVLSLRYGKSESYRFEKFDGVFVLISAQIGDFRLYADPELLNWDTADIVYYAQDAAGTVWAGGDSITLDSFNIRLFPRSTDEVRALNLMEAKLDSQIDCLGWAMDSESGAYSPKDWGTPIQTGRTGTAPVYAAPFGASSWRAAKGKAAVGLNGEIWLLNEYLNADGESWACIRYFVSPRTQRIGYALCSDLGLAELTEQDHDDPGNSFARVDVRVTADTYLTDDPNVGQFRQVALPQGTVLNCMGLYNRDYAYVELEVNQNDRPTDGGAILWGFVPAKHLAPMEKAVRRDVMEQLTGYWSFYAGGNQAEDYLQLNADGTFIGCSYDFAAGALPGDPGPWDQPFPGVWYVTDYNAFENLYWDRPPYELTMIHDNGSVNIKGLSLDENGFSLTYWEGGGGYRPVGEDD